MPLQKCRRTRAKIDGNVPHAAFEAAYELHLGMRVALEVQPADGANRSRTRMVDLDDPAVTEHRCQLPCTEQPTKAAALVLTLRSLDDDNARYSRGR